MTPFHTTNARVWWFLFLCYKSRINVYRNEGHELHHRKKKGGRGSDVRSKYQCSINHTWCSLRNQTGKGHGFRNSMASFFGKNKNCVGPSVDQKKFELSTCLETTWQGINIELKEVAGSNRERFRKVYTWRLAVDGKPCQKSWILGWVIGVAI